MTSKISRACDGCRLRKVKCNGLQPCQQCNHLDLSCRFSLAKERDQRKTVRGRLVAQLKSGQPQEQQQQQQVPYSDDFFFGLLSDYETVVYPVNPVITRAEMAESIKQMHTDSTHESLVYAFAGVTINLTQATWRDVDGDIAARIRDMMDRSFTARSRAGDDTMQIIDVSVHRIMTCVFLEICLMAFNRYDRAFLMLREAISMIQMMETENNKREAKPISDAELARRQRLYWELFIHERFLTIMSSYPSVLSPLPAGLPGEDPKVPRHVHIGFTRLIKLFLIMDEQLLSHWIAQGRSGDAPTTMTPSWIEQKQQELDDDELSARHDASSQAGLTESQVADLFITRLWLRTLVWQLAMSRYLLSSAPPTSAHEAMSLSFPAERLSTQLRSLVVRMKSLASITMHGSGILQKLFEITNTIADVMTLMALRSTADDVAGRQRVVDLIFLIEMLLSFERIDQVQGRILRTKIEALKDKIFGTGITLEIHSPGHGQ